MNDSHPTKGQVRCWLPEILALIGNLLSMISLVTMLAFCDKKPVFDWYGITLNTLVSVISTAAKAPILFVIAESISQWKWILFSQQGRRLIDFEAMDSASRGPWGSVKLLWKCRKDFALLLGAVTIVVATAIDPFSQQLIQYSQVVVEVETPDARIARAQRYSRGSEHSAIVIRSKLGDFSFAYTTTDADYSMQAAVLYGLTHSIEDVMQRLQFTCPSGNCTWDPFESLAVCSVCNNLSEDVSMIKEGIEMANLPAIQGSDPTTYGNVTMFRLSNGHFIDNFEGSSASNPYMTSFGTGNRNETVSLQDVDTLLWGMSFLRVTNQDEKAWLLTDLEATECGLFYCVNRYNATVNNGTLYETEEQVTSASRAINSWLPQDDEKMRALTAFNWVDSLKFDSALSSIQRSDLMLGTQFNFSQSAIDSTSSFFQSNFGSNISVPSPSKNLEMKLTGYARSKTNYQPSSMQAFMSVPNLTTTFQALARSMSNSLRADSDNGTVQTGRNGTMQTTYRIVWQWIALHATVIITGTAFLLMTIHESRKHTIPAWRSSSLAVFSRGAVTKDILYGLATLEELEKQAKQARVQLLDRVPRLKDNTGLKTPLITVEP